MSTKEEGPRSFASFIEQLADGAAHADFGTELFELIKKCKEEAAFRNADAKGTMSIKLGFKVAPHGAVAVEYDVASVAPKRHRMTDTLFITKGGNLSKRDERQPSLPGIRDVSAGLKNIKDPLTANGNPIDPETGEEMAF